MRNRWGVGDVQNKQTTVNGNGFLQETAENQNPSPKAFPTAPMWLLVSLALRFTASSYCAIGGTVTVFFSRMQLDTHARSAISQLSRMSRPLIPSLSSASLCNWSAFSCFAYLPKIWALASTSGSPKCSCKSNRLKRAYKITNHTQSEQRPSPACGSWRKSECFALCSPRPCSCWNCRIPRGSGGAWIGVVA